MKVAILIKVVLVSILIVFLFKVSMFFWITESSKSNNQISLDKNLSEINFKHFNTLTLDEIDYSLILNKEKSTISTDSLVQTLKIHKTELDKLPFIVIVKSKSDYARLVKTLDAITIVDIRNYEFVTN